MAKEEFIFKYFNFLGVSFSLNYFFSMLMLDVVRVTKLDVGRHSSNF